MVNTLSVADIVDFILPNIPQQRGRSILTRRIRHWTLAGAIPAIDSAHQGTGHHRQYYPETVYLAIVLHGLADLGLSIGALRSVGLFIARKISSGELGQSVRPHPFLVISPPRCPGHSLGDELILKLEGSWSAMEETARGSVIFDLERVRQDTNYFPTQSSRHQAGMRCPDKSAAGPTRGP